MPPARRSAAAASGGLALVSPRRAAVGGARRSSLGSAVARGSTGCLAVSGSLVAGPSVARGGGAAKVVLPLRAQGVPKCLTGGDKQSVIGAAKCRGRHGVRSPGARVLHAGAEDP